MASLSLIVWMALEDSHSAKARPQCYSRSLASHTSHRKEALPKYRPPSNQVDGERAVRKRRKGTPQRSARRSWRLLAIAGPTLAYLLDYLRLHFSGSALLRISQEEFIHNNSLLLTQQGAPILAPIPRIAYFLPESACEGRARPAHADERSLFHSRPLNLSHASPNEG